MGSKLVRVINARNLLQTTIYDADNLINKERKSSTHVFQMVRRRLMILANPPSYVRIDWDDSSMDNVRREKSIIETMFENLDNENVNENFFGFKIEDEDYD